MTTCLLIDNYDSYTYNLYHILGVLLGHPPLLIQNDSPLGSLSSVLCIVVGPGPGSPNEQSSLGASALAIQQNAVPVFGVCLGMQAIGLAFGLKVQRSPKPMHGRLSSVSKMGESVLFHGLEFPFNVVRYHSLCVVGNYGESELVQTMTAVDDGVGMALQHKTRPIFGVQFHPESVCAGDPGRIILENFLKFAGGGSIPKSTVSIAKRLRMENQLYIRNEHVKHVDLVVVKVRNPQMDPETLFFSSEFAAQPSNVSAWLDSPDNPVVVHTGNIDVTKDRKRFSILATRSRESQVMEFFVDGEKKKLEFQGSHDDLRNAGENCSLVVYNYDKDGSVSTETKRGFGCNPFTWLKEKLAIIKINQVGISEMDETGKCGASTPASLDSVPFEFTCGYVGVLGYGLRKLCGVKVAPDESKWVDSDAGGAVATADKPESLPDAAFFFCNRAVVFDHAENTAYVLCLDANDEWQTRMARALRVKLANTTIPSPLKSPISIFPSISASEYKQNVEKCLEHILDGDTYEVCLTNQLHAPYAKVDAYSLYCTLRRNNPAPFCGLLSFDASNGANEGKKFFVCSSSPERFLRVDRDGIIESRPIKGTLARNIHSLEEDLKQKTALEKSEKDQAENMMIVDLVRNDLGRVCRLGSVQVPDLMVVESFATVHQLVSTIRGTLEPDTTAVDAARAAFPPGSMTGAPKLRTMQLIDAIECEERGLYSGAMGYFSLSGSADFSVLIRTAIVDKTGVHVGAGGAVVAMSDPGDEHREMILKVNALGGSAFRVVDRE